jgi:hypothetical protein
VSRNRIQQIHIPGGAMVIGSIRAPMVDGLTVNGRGIIAGEVGYAFCETGDYLLDRIYNSAVTMADYNGTRARAQVVEGITSIMPLKYHIQVGAGAIVRHVKCFSFRHTTDGIGAERGARIEDCFFKVNDDVIKLYADDIRVARATIWHQDNGACFQLGWNESHGHGCEVRDTVLLRDDAVAAKSGAGHWSNHAIINWHSASAWQGAMPIHADHLIQGINRAGMPEIPVWRLLAINLDGSHGPGGESGGVLRNLQIRDVMLGPEMRTSYVGATIGDSQAEVRFHAARLGGVCRNAGNVIARGRATVVPEDGCGE